MATRLPSPLSPQSPQSPQFPQSPSFPPFAPSQSFPPSPVTHAHTSYNPHAKTYHPIRGPNINITDTAYSLESNTNQYNMQITENFPSSPNYLVASNGFSTPQSQKYSPAPSSPTPSFNEYLHPGDPYSSRTAGYEQNGSNFHDGAQNNQSYLAPPETREEMGAVASDGDSGAGYSGSGYNMLPALKKVPNDRVSFQSVGAKSRPVKRAVPGGQCEHCNKYFKALHRHKQSIHPDTLPNPPLVYDCPVKNCGRKGFRKDNLTQHLRGVHGHVIPKRRRGRSGVNAG
ncbi:hypothetical protein BDD12DRAFT_889776 [Trichophaea hybrida]|nr:hypothetical protein BDD12DRAFT_889776 [Trichophaea hybrida]